MLNFDTNKKQKFFKNLLFHTKIGKDTNSGQADEVRVFIAS